MNTPRQRFTGMCVLAEYEPYEILAFRGNYKRVFYVGDFPFEIDMNDSRYRVFAQTLCCCDCGLKGTVMRLEYNWDPKGQVEPRFNLYAKTNNGTLVLMTQDHILAKSRGGSDEDSNLRTMCAPCNQRKGNKPLAVAAAVGGF